MKTDIVKVGQIRIWKTDTNHEHFKIIKYRSFFCNEHYFIIEYLTDNRKRVVSEEELLNQTVISHIYDDREDKIMKVLELQQSEWIDGIEELKDSYRYICQNNSGKVICYFDSNTRLNNDEINIKIKETLSSK